MKTEYAPDNTRTSIVVILVLAAVVSLIAVLIGLSPKPQVDAIGVSAGDAAVTAAAAPAPASDVSFGDDDATDAPVTQSTQSTQSQGTALLDEAGEPILDGSGVPILIDDAGVTDDERPIIIVPPSEPTATPEVAAAVEPTNVPTNSSGATAAEGAVESAPSLPTTSGSVQGTFFTKIEENEGAVVSQNLITVSFAEDGSGAFQGVLDITYVDGTHILLNMSGPLIWAAANPQVEATLAGAFTLDAPIDADDVTSDDAELSISSLGAGTGSLCTTKCFGFTFPPQ